MIFLRHLKRWSVVLPVVVGMAGCACERQAQVVTRTSSCVSVDEPGARLYSYVSPRPPQKVQEVPIIDERVHCGTAPAVGEILGRSYNPESRMWERPWPFGHRR